MTKINKLIDFSYHMSRSTGPGQGLPHGGPAGVRHAAPHGGPGSTFGFHFIMSMNFLRSSSSMYTVCSGPG